MNQEQPFQYLKISSQDYLLNLPRKNCEKCGKKRKYFCYDCFLFMGDISKVPTLKLKIPLDIIHHPNELNSKSTGIHAKIIAPSSVNIYQFPNFPDYTQQGTNTIFLLYPSHKSQFISDIDINILKNITKLVVIDSTWQSSKQVLRDIKLKGLIHVKIPEQKTLFWRYQNFGEDYLATIEAIYYFYREYHLNITNSYEGQYDDLLYYYSFFYKLIQQEYNNSQKIFPRKENYIHYFNNK